MIKKRVHSSLHQHLIHVPFDTFTQQGRQWLTQLPLASHQEGHPGCPCARVAVARKLAILAWHLLTKNEPYRYALPASTEHKPADLRHSQGIRHRSGPEKGQAQLPKKSHERVRPQRGLNEVPSTKRCPPPHRRPQPS